MTVTPHDHGRFLCSSDSGESDYVVDLIDGTCECKDFIMRNKKRFGIRCKHLNYVREWIVERVIQELKSNDTKSLN